MFTIMYRVEIRIPYPVQFFYSTYRDWENYPGIEILSINAAACAYYTYLLLTTTLSVYFTYLFFVYITLKLLKSIFYSCLFSCLKLNM